MLAPLRRFGPVALIPAAWFAAGAAEFGYLSLKGLLIAHLVMVAFIAFFIVTAWNELDHGALRAWRVVLAVGFVITVAGVIGFVTPEFEAALLGVSLVGWMGLPAAGLAYTARALPDARLVYAGGAVLSALGAVVFVSALLSSGDPPVAVAFGMVALGQTAGILDAARR